MPVVASATDLPPLLALSVGVHDAKRKTTLHGTLDPHPADKTGRGAALDCAW